MKLFRNLILGAAFGAAATLVPIATPAKAAEPSAAFSTVLTGDLGFSHGGIWGDFLVFNDWSATPLLAYTANTVIKHSSAIWVALTAPGAADEPWRRRRLGEDHRSDRGRRRRVDNGRHGRPDRWQ